MNRAHPPWSGRGLGIGAADGHGLLSTRLKLAIIVGTILAALGVLSLLARPETLAMLRGPGYLPWLEYEWKARQLSEQAQKPLVIYEGRRDDLDLRTLVSAPEVAPLTPGFVWHCPADADPTRRELAVYAWDDPAVVLVETLDLGEVDAEELAELLQEALDENPGHGQRTTHGVFGFNFGWGPW